MSDLPHKPGPHGTAPEPAGGSGLPGSGSDRLVVTAAGRVVSLPLAAIRRIEPAHVFAMPRDPALDDRLWHAVVGMVAVFGVVHGVVSLTVLLGGVMVKGPEARVLCPSSQWLTQVGAGGLMRPGLALLVDSVIDVQSDAAGGEDAVIDLARLLADDVEHAA
jgi:hypothetical protein